MDNDNSTEHWIPPSNPDPEAILREAKRDTKNRLFATALYKYVWYCTEFSIEHPDLQTGTGTTYLIGWARLAQRYPKAKAELINYRDELRYRIISNVNNDRLLEDFLTINYLIGQDMISSELFSELERSNPEHAKHIYGRCEEALVQSRQFETCLKYFNAHESYRTARSGYEVRMEYANSLEDDLMRRRICEFANKCLAYKISIIALLLTVGNNRTEAQSLILDVQNEFGLEEGYCEQLRRAAQGVAPNYPFDRIPL